MTTSVASTLAQLVAFGALTLSRRMQPTKASVLATEVVAVNVRISAFCSAPRSGSQESAARWMPFMWQSVRAATRGKDVHVSLVPRRCAFHLSLLRLNIVYQEAERIHGATGSHAIQKPDVSAWYPIRRSSAMRGRGGPGPPQTSDEASKPCWRPVSDSSPSRTRSGALGLMSAAVGPRLGRARRLVAHVSPVTMRIGRRDILQSRRTISQSVMPSIIGNRRGEDSRGDGHQFNQRVAAVLRLRDLPSRENVQRVAIALAILGVTYQRRALNESFREQA